MSESPRIKICGLTNLHEAEAAIAAGADYLGFVFVPGTPRALSIDAAKTMLTPLKTNHPESRLVGVFQDGSLETISTALQALPLDLIQLHGKEPPDFCAQLPCSVIKAVVLDETPLDYKTLEAYNNLSNLEALILDMPKEASGKTLLDYPDQAALRGLCETFPCLVAGRLTAETVGRAIQTLVPLGVDVASGVEQSSGVKDAEKMRQFCRAVHVLSGETKI